ncbi:D-aminoacylase [Geodia barretti]|uniref:D-aminoacylase n=1 Tax=Geodia barretti TaxID=519541 RepID=A0AA35X7C2_GEOBA|nr:D-aminoacylase [Geodia barretti]
MFDKMEGIPLSAQRAGVDFSWESIPEYLDAIGRRRGINVGAFVGHSGVRRYVMGQAAQEREATPEEIEAMKAEVRKGILAGALGFSVGNFADQGEEIFGVRVPSSVASDAERFAVGDVLGELGTGVFQVSGGAAGGYTTPAGIAQELSRRTGRPAIYNLLAQELSKPDEWKGAPPDGGGCLPVRHQGLCLLPVRHGGSDLRPPRRLGRAGRRGHDQPHHRIPGHDNVGLGDGPAGGGADPLLPRPGDSPRPEHRGRGDRGRAPVPHEPGHPHHELQPPLDLVQVYMAHEERNRRYSGMSVEEVATEQGKGIMDAFLDLVLDDDLRTSFQVIDRNSDPTSQREILGSPYTVIGTTDGGARPDKGDRTTYSTYLLSHWVREEQVLTLEDAVYRMTGKTALMHDLHDRGFIQAGKAADITIFDPDTIGMKPREPMYEFPGGEMHVKQPASGIDYVIVNGEVLLENGEHTGALPGQVLRGPYHQG